MNGSRPLSLGLGLRVGAVMLLLVAMGLLFEGLTLPILTLDKFWIFNNTISIWSAIISLYGSSEYFLATVLLVFSVLFPIGKNFFLIAVFIKGARLGKFSQRIVRGASVLGKWSMLDVFIIAILVASVKLGILAHATVLSALYFFAASVIITNLLSTGMDWWIRREGEKAFLAAARER
ncbi:MAG: paraquat-inducible protein A [Gammaproteobacteria bacterium]